MLEARSTSRGPSKWLSTQDLSFGLFFSITCSEDLPFVNETDVVVVTRDTFLGDYPLRQQQATVRTGSVRGLDSPSCPPISLPPVKT
jgi:hypothetical protein